MLIQKLEQLGVTKSKIISHEKVSLVSDLIIKKSKIHGFFDSSLIICHTSIEQAILALLAFDGEAQSIFIISSNYPKKTILELISQSKCNILLSDRSELQKLPKENIKTFKNVEQLIKYRKIFTAKHLFTKTQWVLSTSGTTGKPKLVPHTIDSLIKTTKLGQYRMEPDTWGLLYDYTRFAGMQVVLQALLSGSHLVYPRFNEELSEKLKFFAINECTHLSATPTLWRKILMVENLHGLSPSQITLGGEIADSRILEALSKKFSRARITHVFASTEAGVGFSVSDKKAGFPLKYLEENNLGINLKIKGNKLFIQNQLTGNRYFETNNYFADQDGWIDTGDVVEVKDGRVIFLGRSTGVINVGGEKVFPEEVEQALLSHNLVKHAMVYPIPSSITGSLICAAVVLYNSHNSSNETIINIREHIAKRLERFKLPAKIIIQDEVDVTSGGKIGRN